MALITYLTRIEFDDGSVAKLPALLAGLKVMRPLIVTDRGLLGAGLLDRVASLLPARPAVFSDTPANPTEDAVEGALERYRQENCDGIVALGGGSSIDLAKAVRLLTGHPGPLAQYTAVEGGVSRIHGDICPLVAVPTTSGTGSEVGRAAVIITHEGRKLGHRQPLHAAERRALRPRTHARPASLAHGRNRLGRPVSLPRDLHGAVHQSAR